MGGLKTIILVLFSLDMLSPPILAQGGGYTSLLVAAANGNTEFIKILLENGTDINAIDNNGKTSLMYAAEKGYVDIVKELLENKADVNAENNNGKTSLMYAAEYGHTDVIKILLENGADINAMDNNGKTSLMYAAENGYIDALKVLLENGADVNAIDNDGKTSLMYAAEYGYTDVIKILVENGADLNDVDINDYADEPENEKVGGAYRPCVKGWNQNPSTGKCYYFLNDSLSWSQAQQACLELQGNLPIVSSKKEDSYVQGQLRLIYGNNNTYGQWGYWTGGKRVDGDDKSWQWWDGSIIVTTFWGTNEPSNETDDACIQWGIAVDWKWFNGPCKAQSQTVCQN